MRPPLLTIGYERATLPQVVQAMRAAGTGLLIDVRAVAASRRPGFSKRILGGTVLEGGIGYLHLRDLGTPKAGRVAARAGRTAEMRAIFADHMETPAAQLALAQATEASRGGRVCLLCYEAEAACCHRAILADLISADTGAEVIHLRPALDTPVGPV